MTEPRLERARFRCAVSPNDLARARARVPAEFPENLSFTNDSLGIPPSGWRGGEGEDGAAIRFTAKELNCYPPFYKTLMLNADVLIPGIMDVLSHPRPLGSRIGGPIAE